MDGSLWVKLGGVLWVELCREQHNYYLCISSMASGPFGSLLSRFFTSSNPMNRPKPLNKEKMQVQL